MATLFACAIGIVCLGQRAVAIDGNKRVVALAIVVIDIGQAVFNQLAAAEFLRFQLSRQIK